MSPLLPIPYKGIYGIDLDFLAVLDKNNFDLKIF
jgi:hypothetical protein